MTSILFGIVRICSYLFKCNYVKNKTLFLKFLFRLWNLHQILNIFGKKMIVIANVFPKLQNVKDLVKPVSWKHRFRNSFDSQQVNGCQTLVKSAWKQFYQILWSLSGEMICKISPFVNFKILGVFANTFTVDHKYPVWNCENLQFHIEMQLSRKQKRFSQFYVPFMESSSNSKHFPKKDDRDSLSIFEIKDCQNLGGPICKKRRFRTSFGSQHLKGFQTLVKSAWERFYHIFWSLWKKMTGKISPLLNFEILEVFVNTLIADEKYPFRDSRDLQIPI